MSRTPLLGLPLVLVSLVFLAACEVQPEIPTTPPEGWSQDDMRWWRTGTDTTKMFRDLATLQTMGIAQEEEIIYTTNLRSDHGSKVFTLQLSRAVKQSLIRLYRNQPELVDSLFEKFVQPKIEKAQPSGDLSGQVDRYKKEGLRIIHRHFSAPRSKTKVGIDIPLELPDSLRHVSGRIQFQVYLDDQGLPQSVTLLEGVHPIVDAVALHANTQATWYPAQLLEKGRRSVTVPSWVRYALTLGGRPGD